jgi:hypothetical protein
MNWYKKILYAQIWETNYEDSFEENLTAFYELEYKYNALKNFPFTGMPQRYENILENVKDSLMESMERLKGVLASTFYGWLETHAITEPATWAAKRVDPHGEGFMSSYDAENALEGIVGEYIRYKNGGMYPQNRPNTSNVFSEMLDQALQMSDKFTSLQKAEYAVQEMERERLTEDLYNDEFENFGTNERGEAFQSEEEAEAYIEERVEAASVQDYVWNFGKEELLSLLEGQGQMEEFLIELNQHMVFPLWYDYWGAMGIDTTRELAEDAYEGLINANTFEEFHTALGVAILTCHQNGSMLEYLSEYGNEYVESSPEDIEIIMDELTEGKTNVEWDKQLKAVGVKVPIEIRKHNLEVANK